MDKKEYFWVISRMTKRGKVWESLDTMEESNNTDSITDNKFYSPHDAYKDGLLNLQYYEPGHYGLRVYYFAENGEGEYEPEFEAEIHNGKIIEHKCN